MSRTVRLLLISLVSVGCATTAPERMSFSEAFATRKAPREPKKKKALEVPAGAVPSPELESALIRFGNQLRAGRANAIVGSAMPRGQAEAWAEALTGVEKFLGTDVATMSPFDLVRARVVLEAELEADAVLWGDFPKEIAERTQALISTVKAKSVAVTALRTPPRPVNWKKFRWPMQPVVITSPFGERVHPITGDYKLHKGVDLMAEPAQAIYAPYAGTVVFSGWQGAYGKHIELQHDLEVTTTYSHLISLMVKEGDVVKKGQLIGLAGDTGSATGVHLHFELYRQGHPVDPELSLPPTIDFFRVAEAAPW